MEGFVGYVLGILSVVRSAREPDSPAWTWPLTGRLFSTWR